MLVAVLVGPVPNAGPEPTSDGRTVISTMSRTMRMSHSGHQRMNAFGTPKSVRRGSGSVGIGAVCHASQGAAIGPHPVNADSR